MAASDKVFIAALFLMIMLSISDRGVSAQSSGCEAMVVQCTYRVTVDDKLACNNAMACIDALSDCNMEEKNDAKKKLNEKGCVSAISSGCKTEVRLCEPGGTGDNFNEMVCNKAWTCIDALSLCNMKEKDVFKKKLIKKGCSGSGIPIISAMSLFVAALFHML